MCVPGQEPALLVRVAVDRVVEQVGADPAVVEQRVALARRAVAGDALALAPLGDQELEQAPLGLLDLRGERRGGPRACRSRARARARPGRAPAARPAACRCRRAGRRAAASRRGVLSSSTSKTRGRGRRRPSGPTGTRSTGSARGRSCRTGSPRPAAAGAAPRPSRRRRGASRISKPATKSLRSGTCAITLLAATRSARRPSATSSSAVSRPKKRTIVSIPSSRATSATFAAGSMPSAGMPRSTTCRSR